jgi:4-amino-4-deoxy-L-arabinose transferase-like glycosyltransferase
MKCVEPTGSECLLTPDGNRLSWRAYILLVLLCLAFFLPGLTTIPPVDRDEPHFAQASKQMIETGNYTDIRFQEDTRYKKPIGVYWLQAASVKLLSPDHLDAIWAYRVPSLIGATLAVAMTAALGSLLFGPLAGFLAAFLMACCVLLNVEARMAKTDAALLACVMVAQYALARAYVAHDQTAKPGWLVALAFWTAQGIGFLIKGPIVLLVTLSTLIWLWFCDKKIGWFQTLRPLIGLPYALLITAPWFIAIMLASHGEFATQAGGHDLLAKIWQGQDRGILPPGLHLLAFPGVFFPGSLFALLALPDVWRQRHDPLVRFCLGWIIPTWIVFELSLTKLPHYVLPLYPAIAILAAKIALDGFPALAERRWRWLLAAVSCLWLVVGIAFGAGLAILPYVMDHVWNVSAIVAGVILVASQIVALAWLRRRPMNGILALGTGTLLFTLLTFGMTFPSLQKVWLTRQIMQVAESVKPCASAKLISASFNEPSLVFMAGTDTQFINNGAAVADTLRSDACLLALLDKDHQQAFLESFAGDPIQPVAISSFSGPNIGSGRHVDLTLYRLPAKGIVP